MDVIYFVKALLKKKWWIILSTMLALVAAFFFTMGRAKLYVSTAQISTGFTVKDQITLRDENVNLYEADVKFENTIQTLYSPLVISLLSYNLLIHDLTSNKPFRILTEKDLKSKEYLQFNKEEALRICRLKLDSLQMLTSYKPEERKLLEYMKLCKYDNQSITKTLRINRLPRTDYIDISYGSENAEQSAYVVNTLYQEFIRYYRSLRSERGVENVETFEELVNKKKVELDIKVEALRNYKTNEKIVSVATASGTEMGLISTLEKNLLDERANLNILTANLNNLTDQISKANQGKPTFSGGTSGGNNNEIVNLRKQINQLNDEYLATGSTDEKIAEKLKVARKQLATLYSTTSAPVPGTPSTTITKEQLIQNRATVESDISATKQTIAGLVQKIGQLKYSVGKYANQEATVGSLEQELLLAQDEYNKLKEKLNSAIDNRSVPLDNFRQTLKGQPAFKPESSKRIVIMGMVGIAVFMLTTLGILFKEFFDSSIKSPSNFQKNVDLKLISTINHADLNKYSILEVLQKRVEDNKTILKRQNSFREFLRKLRFEIENSGKSIFLFTSTESRQGKTTLVQAVAYSLSLSNKRVLVIDTNFCNNDLTVQLEAKPTLETFSIAPNEFSIDKVREIVTTYSIENIEVIGCKGGDYTPTEILPKNHLLNYLPRLKEYYDFILFEGAPLNEYTDSKELEKYAEGVVAIFSSKASVKQNDKESIEFLQGLGDKFLGAVLNNINDDYLEL